MMKKRDRLKAAILSACGRACGRKRPPAPQGASGTGFYITVAVIGAGVFVLSAGLTLAGVGATKHNFGSLSTAEIKTAETTEICVFCHTPHNANPSGPIWNKQDQGSTYNVYESQSLAATLSPNAPTLGQPTGSSKLCLACHDGTVAVGSLLNMPGKKAAGSMSMAGAGIDVSGRLTAASTAYIGTDLRDDHPISFGYSLSYPANPEIKGGPFTPAEVKLDSSGKVQCTSCHDPHGTDFPKFLVAGMESGSICIACHDKRYWATLPSAHKTSTKVWNGTGNNPWEMDMGAPGFGDDTPALQSCFACHKSHGGIAGKPLLRGKNLTGQMVDEEWTCLNCHNGNVAAKNVEPAFNNLYKHDVKGVFGGHVPSRQLPGEPAREAPSRLTSPNRHVECADCHNPHGIVEGSHEVGGINGNIVGPNLLGNWGVKPNPWPVAGSYATSYIAVDFNSTIPGSDNLEGYLCLKCHSYYAFGTTPPFTPSQNADGSPALESDLSASMNVNNASYHPVFAQGKNRPPVGANPFWPANGLGLTNTFRYMDIPGITPRTGFYNMTHESTVTCSDCHGSDFASDPKGVHGSSSKWIMRANETGVGSTKNFCYNCHRRDVYGDEDYNPPLANQSRVSHPVDGLSATASDFYKSGANTGNNSNRYGILCMTCHGGSYDAAGGAMKDGSHGSNAPAGTTGDPLGYRMMNGACVTDHTRATTATSLIPTRAQMTFRNSVDAVCNNSTLGIASGNYANYDCNNIADCSN